MKIVWFLLIFFIFSSTLLDSRAEFSFSAEESKVEKVEEVEDFQINFKLAKDKNVHQFILKDKLNSKRFFIIKKFHYFINQSKYEIYSLVKSSPRASPFFSSNIVVLENKWRSSDERVF